MVLSLLILPHCVLSGSDHNWINWLKRILPEFPVQSGPVKSGKIQQRKVNSLKTAHHKHQSFTSKAVFAVTT